MNSGIVSQRRCTRRLALLHQACRWLAAGLLLSAVCVSIVSSRPGSDSTGQDIEQIEQQVFEQVNRQRQALGLHPLQRHDRLDEAARAHSQDMAERRYVSHINPDGYRLIERLRLAGVRSAREIAENVGSLPPGRDLVERMVQLWMNSSGHRSNIVNPRFKYTGIGVARAADGVFYFTQVFTDR
ncbi:MAG: CAP domain-containing protein [Acidobacteriota bacterium]|nr:CAP domain-containing protein [Blastocatellia bacterium]MDW8241225.1 CAP domain-containing protein [Acidobacteriota bacterium]